MLGRTSNPLTHKSVGTNVFNCIS